MTSPGGEIKNVHVHKRISMVLADEVLENGFDAEL